MAGVPNAGPKPVRPTIFRPDAVLDPSQVVDHRKPVVEPKPMLVPLNRSAQVPKMPKKHVPNPHNIHR